MNSTKVFIDSAIKYCYLTAILLLTMFFCHHAVKANGGGLDTGFDGDGKVITQLSSVNRSYGHGSAIQTDGKIVVVGHAELDSNNPDSTAFAVTRYNSNGSLDTTFGSGSGKVITDLGPYKDVAFSVALQSDGSIIVAGYYDGGSLGAEKLDFAVVRYKSDGTLDLNFGTNGLVTTDFGGVYDLIRNIAVQPDGKIVAAGYGNYQFAVARYTANGALDTTFKSVGTVITPIGAASYAEDVVLQADGKIVVAGTTHPNGGQEDVALVRYNANGSLDASFQGGIVTTDAGGANYRDTGKGVALQADGKIVVAGSRSLLSPIDLEDFVVLRYTIEGKLDTGFDNDGIVITSFGIAANEPDDVAVQKDGKIVAAGYSRLNGVFRFSIARYNPNGSLDQSFDGDGKVETNFDFNTYDVIEVVNIQKDGKIVAVGSSSPPNAAYFAVARYQPGGYAPLGRGAFDFDGDGKTDVSTYRPDNQTLFWKSSLNGNSNSYTFPLLGDWQPAPADYDGDWQTDLAVWWEASGNWLILNSSTNTLSSLYLGGSGDMPMAGYFDADDKADRAVFRPSNGTWYWVKSSDGTTQSQVFGVAVDVPVTADFNNDGESDLVVWRPSNGIWYWKKISDTNYSTISFGLASDTPTIGDYDGDGKSDAAVFRNTNGSGIWYLQQSTAGFSVLQFGVGSDRPVPSDYDGDGRTDLAVWRDSTAAWYWLNSSGGTFNALTFGVSGDFPVPSSYLP